MEGSGDGIKRRESNEGGGMIGGVERQRERERWSNIGDREERIMHALETMRSERERDRGRVGQSKC